MDRKVIALIAVLLILSLGVYFSFGKKTTTTKKTDEQSENIRGNGMTPTDNNLYPMGIPTDIWDSALSNFDGKGKKNYDELIDGLRTGEIVFTWEIWSLRRNCPPEFTGPQCDATLIAYLDKNYNSPEREKLKELFESYFKYEAEVRTLQVPENATFEERYEILKNKRRDLLGKEKTELLFGLEETQVSFIEASQNFFTSTKNLPPSERVKKFDELKKKVYGGYLQAVEKREDPFDRYQTELELREKEFIGLSVEDKEKKLYSLEVKYFGKEKADLMAKTRKEEQDYTSKIENYKKIEEDFLKSNSGLKPEEKERKLKELRIKHLGEEEAESYKNRLQFEEETKNL
jgi:hypothetical protein